MASARLGNYLRKYRRQSGLTQGEVAFLLGRKNGALLSRYEMHRRLPPLRTALAFEAIYKTPLADMFPGIRDSVARETSERIARLGLHLQIGGDPKRHKRLIARKRSWIAAHQLPPAS
jgi:transcriptional regulator with XRE-family HTH domain